MRSKGSGEMSSKWLLASVVFLFIFQSVVGVAVDRCTEDDLRDFLRESCGNSYVCGFDARFPCCWTCQDILQLCIIAKETKLSDNCVCEATRFPTVRKMAITLLSSTCSWIFWVPIETHITTGKFGYVSTWKSTSPTPTSKAAFSNNEEIDTLAVIGVVVGVGGGLILLAVLTAVVVIVIRKRQRKPSRAMNPTSRMTINSVENVYINSPIVIPSFESLIDASEPPPPYATVERGYSRAATEYAATGHTFVSPPYASVVRTSKRTATEDAATGLTFVSPPPYATVVR